MTPKGTDARSVIFQNHPRHICFALVHDARFPDGFHDDPARQVASHPLKLSAHAGRSVELEHQEQHAAAGKQPTHDMCHRDVSLKV